MNKATVSRGRGRPRDPRIAGDPLRYIYVRESTKQRLQVLMDSKGHKTMDQAIQSLLIGGESNAAATNN